MKHLGGCILTVLLSVLLSSSSALSQGAVRAGRIAEFDGRSNEYVVRREDREVPVTYNMALVSGDQVVVRVPNRWMRISYVDGSGDTVTVTNSPFVIDRQLQVADRQSNFVRDLWQRVTRDRDDGLATHVVRDLNTLSLDTPGLADGSATIAAGDRHFMLGWTGGPGPYRVVVRNAVGEVFIEEGQIPTRQLIVSSRLIRFAPGLYTVEVSTATQQVRGGFEAVASGALPIEPLATDVEGAVEAAERLAVQADRAHLYEAYLQLYSGLRADYGPARALGDYLVGGAPN